MPEYFSEVSYSGMHSAGFIEVAVAAGTDVSGYTVQVYESDGSLHDTYSFGASTQTIAGKDVYLFDNNTPLWDGLDGGDAIALVDDLGNVVQFVSFGGPTVTASNGDAAGLTSTDIGSAGMGQSLQSDDDGASYYTQSSQNPGSIPCYSAGTLIDTPDGPREVQSLQIGDLVETLDHGAMPICWLRRRDQKLPGAGTTAGVVLIRAGTFAAGSPARDLLVSPQHRILLGGCGQLDDVFPGQCFAAAKALTGLPGVRMMRGVRRITWVHFAFDSHEVVCAEGCYSESLLLGPMVLNGLTGMSRRAAARHFGEPAHPGAALNSPAARDCLSVGEARRAIADIHPDSALSSHAA